MYPGTLGNGKGENQIKAEVYKGGMFPLISLKPVNVAITAFY